MLRYKLRKASNLGLMLEKLPRDIDIVKHQLREAIEQQLITPDEYEALTQLDFDTQEELTTYLRDCLHELEGWFPSKGG